MKKQLIIVVSLNSLFWFPISLLAQGGHLFEGTNVWEIFVFLGLLAIVVGSLFLPLLLIIIKMGCQSHLIGPLIVNYLLPFPSSIIAFMIAEDHLNKFILVMTIIQVGYILLLWGYCWRKNRQ
jgi:cyanate permease